MSHHQPNRWKGLVLGTLGGAAGLLAMRLYWQAVTRWRGEDPRKMRDQSPRPEPLDDISLFGKQYREGESSSAAMGRILYTQVTGKEPQSQETKTALSYLVHWAIGLSNSGLYGAARGKASFPDVSGGVRLGFGLWFFGDELFNSVMGLAGGPTAYHAALHAYSLGAHIAYGIASAAATQFLYRLF